MELVRTAWISDDAAITLRTVLNFLHGYGPVFNVGERVQAYTHPLWFLSISAVSALLGNVFYSTYFLSIVLSLLALYMLVSRAQGPVGSAVLAGVVLIFSKAYLDYSTSGLENPLSHVLIVVASLLAAKVVQTRSHTTVAAYFLTCSFLYLCRPDLLALIFPATLLVVHACWNNKTALLKAVFIGALPAIAWTAFSLFYYGFPFPNTAYAKLGTGIPLPERAMQGLRYLLDSLARDPVTLVAIGFGAIIAIRKKGLDRAWALGLMVYVAYVVSIGGDFMSGRFLAAPLLVSAILISRMEWSPGSLRICVAGVAVFAVTGVGGTLLSSAAYQNTEINANGIADERGYYFQTYGLVNTNKDSFRTPVWNLEHNAARRVQVTCGGLGFYGVHGGPALHLIDYCGLSDSLLARLPAKYDENWRIGHFLRQLPENYERSVRTGKNLITDRDTHALYEKLRIVTQAPLNDPARLRAIARLNWQASKYDLDKYRFDAIPQDSAIPAFMARNHEQPVADGSVWNASGNLVVDGPVDLVLASRKKLVGFDLSLDAGDRYRVEFYSNGAFHPLTELGPMHSASGGMTTYRYDSPHPAYLVDRVRITPVFGDGMYAIGHIRFHD